MSKYFLFLLLVLYCLFFTCQPGKGPSEGFADLLLINAKIWTGNTAQPWATWVAVGDGEILAIGSEETAAPEADEVIDLGGPQPAGDDWLAFGALKTHIDGEIVYRHVEEEAPAPD